jgi:hypothetical protein
MTLLITVNTTAFDGSQSVTLRDKTDPSYPEDFTIYPKFRDSPAAAWKQLSQIATGAYFSINDSGKLLVWNQAAYDVIFSSSSLATAFGFSSTTTSASAFATTTANSALTFFTFDRIDTDLTKSRGGHIGHGNGAKGIEGFETKITLVGTRSNVSSLISALENNNHISLSDTYFGPVSWTMGVKSLKFTSVGTSKAKLDLQGTIRV